MRSARTRVLVSSIGRTAMATSGPSTWRLTAVLAQAMECRQHLADGMCERSQVIG